MSGKNHPNFGKHLPKEIKIKISKSRKGKKLSEETKNKLSQLNSGKKNKMYGIKRYGKDNPMFGKHHSEEFKRTHSERMKGKYCGENSPNSILTEKDVIQINMLIKLGLKNIEISKLFNISRQTISHIKNKRIWTKIGEYFND